MTEEEKAEISYKSTPETRKIIAEIIKLAILINEAGMYRISLYYMFGELTRFHEQFIKIYVVSYETAWNNKPKHVFSRQTRIDNLGGLNGMKKDLEEYLHEGSHERTKEE